MSSGQRYPAWAFVATAILVVLSTIFQIGPLNLRPILEPILFGFDVDDDQGIATTDFYRTSQKLADGQYHVDVVQSYGACEVHLTGAEILSGRLRIDLTEREVPDKGEGCIGDRYYQTFRGDYCCRERAALTDESGHKLVETDSGGVVALMEEHRLDQGPEAGWYYFPAPLAASQEFTLWMGTDFPKIRFRLLGD